MSNEDPSGERRTRGRPAIGPAIPVRLSEQEKSFAESLGDGVVAKGVRNALKAARRLERDAVLRLASVAFPDSRTEAPRSRGRPRIGKPIPIRLTSQEQETADALGLDDKGKPVTAEGVRKALRACSCLGAEATLKLIS